MFSFFKILSNTQFELAVSHTLSIVIPLGITLNEHKIYLSLSNSTKTIYIGINFANEHCTILIDEMISFWDIFEVMAKI